MCPILRFMALLLIAACSAGASAAPEDNLVLAARTWGLAKYFHPRVTACALDWDQALLDRVARIEAAPDDAALATELGELLDAAGEAGTQAPGAGTPAWIANAPAALRARLAWLAAQRPSRQCYVRPTQFTGQADFADDKAHAAVDPDRAHRVLAMFRFWNAIEFWFPYKPEIGRDWAVVLREHLAPVLEAPDRLQYIYAMRGFTAQIEDSHAGLGFLPPEGPPRFGIPAFDVRAIEGKDIVTQVLPAAAASVRPGDELVAVDGSTAAELRRIREPLAYGSNPAFENRNILLNSLNGYRPEGVYRLRRPDGSEYEAVLPRRYDQVFHSLQGAPVWEKRVAAGGCSMGVIDMGRLMPDQVDAALNAVRDADALVFDLRNYPNGTGAALARKLFDRAHPATIITRPRFDAPGTFFDHPLSIVPGPEAVHRGPFLVLQDERSISQSEFVMMMLQAGGTAISIGSQTAAADGNVTQIELPGGLFVTFTGLGVLYPDRRPTQRIGIVPDVHVVPTRAGLAAGRDEVLEAALDCAWLAQRPAKRTPASGIYADPARGGEGIDVHRDAEMVAMLSYGYTDAGEPEWLLAAAPRSAPVHGKGFTRSRARGATSEPVAADADFHAGPYEPACASSNQNALHPRARLRWPLAGGVRDACQLPLLASGASALTGLWAGPVDDAGWGISVHHADGVLTTIVYAYDNAGEPRWLLGQGGWSGRGAVTLPLRRLRGACRACPGTPPSESPAGTLTLKLDGVTSGNAEDNWLSLEARFDEEAPWTRHLMPLRRVTQRAR